MDADARFRLDYDMGIGGSWVHIDEVGVDSTYIDILRALEPMRDNLWSNPEWTASDGYAAEPSGPDSRYVEAPPLVGVWATAPFLHNGAVPTVRHMLDSGSRPTVWKLDEDPAAYDYEDLGVSWSVAEDVVPVGERTEHGLARVRHPTRSARHGQPGTHLRRQPR